MEVSSLLGGAQGLPQQQPLPAKRLPEFKGSLSLFLSRQKQWFLVLYHLPIKLPLGTNQLD